jgi:hypothetical protein
MQGALCNTDLKTDYLVEVALSHILISLFLHTFGPKQLALCSEQCSAAISSKLGPIKVIHVSREKLPAPGQRTESNVQSSAAV